MNHELQKLIDAGVVIFAKDRFARWVGTDLKLLPECPECGLTLLDDSVDAEYGQCLECWAEEN